MHQHGLILNMLCVSTACPCTRIATASMCIATTQTLVTEVGCPHYMQLIGLFVEISEYHASRRATSSQSGKD